MKTALNAVLMGAIIVGLARTTLAAPQPRPSDKELNDYKLGPDSQRHPGVPAGKMFHFEFDQSKVFPGTTRTISVYVPAEYKADKPACVYVGLDGLGFDVPVVFDNLIAKKEMPVTIAIGISPGHVPSEVRPGDPRFNRSLEFDGLSDALARLVLDEVLPLVEQHKTPDGLPILLSKNPNDRCTAGGSTGAIAAFTLAWQRPDAFRRVFTAVGTFVGMRGGDRYPVLVRKTEPKPIRVFMQDGSNDEWMGGPEVGDWWMGNQTLERALEFSGYQVDHIWGHGTHNGAQAAAVFPDAMRFLWKDWPAPVTTGQTQNHFLQEILSPGDTWQIAAAGEQASGAMAADAKGDVYFRGRVDGKIFRVSDDPKSPQAAKYPDGGGAMAFGPDGKLYLAKDDKLLACDDAGNTKTIVDAMTIRDLVVTHGGDIYLTEPGSAQSISSQVQLIRSGGEKVRLDGGLNHAAGIVLSPDGCWLAVVESKTHWGYSYRVKKDGTVDAKQQFYWLTVPDTADDSGAGSLCMDAAGRLYAATRMGVQVLDRNGRTRAILPLPGSAPAAGLCFGGPHFDTLYVVAAGKVFKRKMKDPGVPPSAAPVKLPPWGAG